MVRALKAEFSLPVSGSLPSSLPLTLWGGMTQRLRVDTSGGRKKIAENYYLWSEIFLSRSHLR